MGQLSATAPAAKAQGTMEVDASYLKDNEPVIRELLQRASIRPAHMLDMAFSD
jgi:hypothetical protein